jgi:hypothetical protein
MDKAKILHEAQAELQRYVHEELILTKVFRSRWVGMASWLQAVRLVTHPVYLPASKLPNSLVAQS